MTELNDKEGNQTTTYNTNTTQSKEMKKFAIKETTTWFINGPSLFTDWFVFGF